MPRGRDPLHGISARHVAWRITIAANRIIVQDSAPCGDAELDAALVDAATAAAVAASVEAAHHAAADGGAGAHGHH